jgi:TPR repeat protein
MRKPTQMIVAALLIAVMLAGTLEDATAADSAVAVLLRGANAGDSEAQAFLGMVYYFGRGAPQDYAEAIKWYRKAANQGV